MKKKSIAYYPLKVVWTLVSLIPLPVLYVFSDLLFYPFYYLVRYRRKTVRKNLTLCFEGERKEAIAWREKRFYRFFLDLIFETVKFGTISHREIDKRMRYVNLAAVNETLRAGYSISLYLGHLGCWEWLSSMPLYLDSEAMPGQVYKKISNSVTNDLLLDNRSHFGAINVPMKSVPRWLKEQKDNGRKSITGYIADQSPKKRDAHHFVRFFNQEVPVITGAEKISKKYGMHVFYVDMIRTKRGYYEAHFVKMTSHPQEMEDYKLTEQFYQYLEASIKRDPAIYLWTHNRFKYKRNEQTNN